VGGPNVFFLAINMAKTYAALGRDDEAGKYFERAEALSPDNAQPYFLYAQWLKEKGRLAESRAHQEASVRAMLMKVHAPGNGGSAPLAAVQGDMAEDLLNQSAEFCKAGRYPECYAVAAEALRVRPGFAEAYNNMAAALFSMQRWDEGIAAARRALAIKPDYEAARSNLEWGLEHKGKGGSSGR
jgi:tetratricopeptide (TPR) repeat protein